MQKIKILFITGGRFFDNRHRKLLSVIRNLDYEKYEFSIVCPENFILIDKFKAYDVPVYVIDLPRRISSRFTSLITKLQLGEAFHIVHSFDFTSGIYSRELKKQFKDIICIHSPEPLSEIENEGFLKRQIDKSTEQYLAQFTNRMLCENPAEELLAVENKYIDHLKVSLIPNSVNMSAYANLKRNKELIEELGFSESNFIIGNISNFGERNNQVILIRAAYYLVRKYPQMRFVFMGDGRTLKSMKEMVIQCKLDNHVTFLFEKENLPDYYSIFDQFVLTDKWGGSATILLEAMASQLPVIHSNADSYKYISKDGMTGLGFDPLDMDDLYWKVESLYTDPEKRNLLAQNAMIEATQYDDSEVFPLIETIYKEELGL